MNCVNYEKKTVCMVLMLAFVLISCLGAFATSENPKKLGILASSIKITDTKVEYIEYKDDGAYFVEETISGNIITSDFYKISNGEKIHSSQIISSVSGKNVISRETDANGQVTTYSVKGIVSRDTNEKSIVPYVPHAGQIRHSAHLHQPRTALDKDQLHALLPVERHLREIPRDGAGIQIEWEPHGTVLLGFLQRSPILHRLTS